MTSDSAPRPQRDVRLLIAAVVMAAAVVVAVFTLGVERPPELPLLQASQDAPPAASIAWTSWAENEQCLYVAEPNGTYSAVRCGIEGELVAFNAEVTLELMGYGGGPGRTTNVTTIDRQSGEIVDTRATDQVLEYNDWQQASWVRDGDELVVRYNNRDVWRVSSRASYTVFMTRVSPDGEHIVVADSANRIILLTVAGDVPARVWVAPERARNRFGFNTVLWEGESLLADAQPPRVR